MIKKQKKGNKQFKEPQIKYQQKEKNEQLIQTEQSIQKVSLQDTINKLPNKLLDMTNRSIKKLEQSVQNLRILDNHKVEIPTQLNIQPIIQDFHKNVIDQYLDHEKINIMNLAESIRGVPKSQLSIQKIEIPTFEEPFKNKYLSI